MNVMAPNPKAALGFIFLTLLIDVTGLGIIIPVMPKLIEELTHGNISVASRYGGWLTFAYAIMQFLFSPFLVISAIHLAAGPSCYFHCLVLAWTMYFFPLHLLSPGFLWGVS